MRAIVNGKLYDTETAEDILDFQRKCNGPSFGPGYYFPRMHVITLHRTKKEAWFEYDKDSWTITPITEEAAKDILSRLDVGKFLEVFGAVPEA